ncbi:PIN domain-like protein, partial [Mycena belliarum]
LFHSTPGPEGQALVLEKLFYQLCNFLLAPATFVFIFDGPGRPSMKRGTKVVHRPLWLIQHLKAMIKSFGFHLYDAPGEAEAELGQLSESGQIDAVITEDSDTLVFGARCIIRTLGPSIEHNCNIYTSDAIENSESVALDKEGLLLCALLLGGDYHPGIPGVGMIIAHALARQHFGHDLVNILRNFTGSRLNSQLVIWRDSLCQELRTNSSGLLEKCRPKLADMIPDSFPDVRVAHLYWNPLTSKSPHYLGPLPDAESWKPKEPAIFELAHFCSSRFNWVGASLLKKLNSNLWPGVVFKMISSVKFSLYPKIFPLMSIVAVHCFQSLY